jgi:hypothetical protein
MQGRLRRIAALVIVLIFGTLELSSSAPGLHRHHEGLDGLLRSAQASASGLTRLTLASPDGQREQAPRECPACTISGLVAVVSRGVPAWAPATRVHSTPPDAVRALPAPFIASVRGRAPPSAPAA